MMNCVGLELAHVVMRDRCLDVRRKARLHGAHTPASDDASTNHLMRRLIRYAPRPCRFSGSTIASCFRQSTLPRTDSSRSAVTCGRSACCSAYTQGIFPWYAENLPILWHSPDPRMVMTTRDLVVQRSLRKAIKKRPYELTIDTAFDEVLRAAPRRRARARPARG